MVETLVLVRHGKAEPGSPTLPDIERSLTSAGRAALAAPEGFPTIFARLDGPMREQAELWVSPALRARQTAEEVAAVIGARPLIEHESLWEQDGVAFLDELAAADARTVIAVGHIPFMNELLDWLTGEAERFSPGGVAAIRLSPTRSASELGGTLLWTAKAPKA